MTTPTNDPPPNDPPTNEPSADAVGEQVEETTDERSSGVADKAELERAVEEKTALVRELAEAEPNVSEAPPVTDAGPGVVGKASAAGKAPAKKAAAKKAPAKKAPAKKAVGKKTSAAAKASSTPPVAVPPAPVNPPQQVGPPGREVSGDELRAVVEGWSHDPHGVLGTHRTTDGWAVRTLRPDAVAVAVVDQDGSRYEARQIHGSGIISQCGRLRAS